MPCPPYPGRIPMSSGWGRSMAIAETGYLSGTPKKAPENCPSEWFYIDDVPLPDPVRTGLPKFSNAPSRAHLSWHPRGPQEKDTREIHLLMSRIKLLAKSGLTIIEVMAICIIWGVQPLQYRGKPMWHFNGEDDATRCGRKGPDSVTTLARIMSDLYKGEEEDFLHQTAGRILHVQSPKLGKSSFIFSLHLLWRSLLKLPASIFLSRI